MIFLKTLRCSFLLCGFLLLFFLFSCAYVSPVSLETISLETISLERMQAVVFASVEAVEPEWLPFAGGVGFFHGRILSPKLEFWALRVDLTSQDIRIVVSGAASGGQTLSARVSSFVYDNNLIAGINALPFDVITPREGLPIRNIGIVISNGEMIAPVNPRYDALVFYKDGKAAIVNQSSIRSIENIENAAGGFHQILIDGQPAERTLHAQSRHPRSAAGLCADGGFLYLLVIDGRRTDSVGATEQETALLLQRLGSLNGLNLDGGGSSTLAMRYPDGRVRTVNTPVHRIIPGRERPVAASLGIQSVLPRENQISE